LASLATAKRFVSEGAYVFLTGLYQKEIDEAILEIGKNVSGIQSDVSNLADIDKIYDVVSDQKGHIDILFSNAGIIKFAPLGVSEEQFDKIFDIDVKGLLFTVQKALPIFQDGGSIILMASVGSSKGSAVLIHCLFILKGGRLTSNSFIQRLRCHIILYQLLNYHIGRDQYRSG
jgi:NAD(P)-dependent dehydrogenase (short-subunit alcohol dehydrogenase family)